VIEPAVASPPIRPAERSATGPFGVPLVTMTALGGYLLTGHLSRELQC